MIVGVLLAARRRRAGSSCASACCRSTAWATRPARSPAATSRTASSRPTPRTEVGRLGLALNAMLDRLEEAFAERAGERGPAARASSPTPRTSCARRWPRSAATPSCSAWARRASREDVEKAMRRIEDEAARMGVLVEDLLTLARLDEVRDAAARRGRPRARSRATPSTTRARPRPTARSTLDADGPARRARRRRTSCARCSPTCCATRSSTRRRARRSRSPSAATDGDGARSRCATTARACPTDDPDALFERFWRAEGGRERGKAGAGLGLAIVAGDRRRPRRPRRAPRTPPGGGARFTVTLPATPQAAPSGIAPAAPTLWQ